MLLKWLTLDPMVNKTQSLGWIQWLLDSEADLHVRKKIKNLNHNDMLGVTAYIILG